MIQILFLLVGTELIRRRWWMPGLVGATWALLGVALCVDALDGVMWVRPHYLGVLMLFEGLVTMLGAIGSSGAARTVRLCYGGMVFLLGALVIDSPWHSDLVIALVAGSGLLADAVWRIASAYVVRFAGWRARIGYAGLEVLFAIFMLEPWPTWYKGEVETLTGALFIVSGIGLVHLALRVLLLPPGTPLAALVGRIEDGLVLPPVFGRAAGGDTADTLIVHVWTPEGGNRSPVYRSVRRYIAAVDKVGSVSTGHAALELGPDLYISHYPAVEIDRTGSDFTRVLRATADNDVPGRFLPDYASEAAGWCEAPFHVRFGVSNPDRLRAFWERYRQDATYNLTSRNCSTAVARALDIAVEGALDRRSSALPSLPRILVSPELWMAAIIRERAQTMAWTPGLVLDYARALNATLSPPLLPWRGRVRQAVAQAGARRRRGRARSGSENAAGAGAAPMRSLAD